MAPTISPDPRPDLEVRRAVPRDAGAIASIYNRAIQERVATFETGLRDEAAVRGWMEGDDGRHPVLVAVARGGGGSQGILGWASIVSYSPRACYSGVGDFSVYVREGERGRGVGQKLLVSLLDEARKLGYWKLLSRIFPQNAASRRLVARCGFREVGVFEKHGKLDGRWLDTVIVERLIPENLR